MKPSERTLQAMKWLVELETNQHVEQIWPAFDAWFQASAANRREYARLKRAMLHRGTLIGPRRSASQSAQSEWPDQVRSLARLFSFDREIYLIAAALALLALITCLAQPSSRTRGNSVTLVDVRR